MIKSIQLYFFIGLLLITGTCTSLQSQANNSNDRDVQTTMADELKAAINQGGVAAAKKRFAEIYPAQKSKYPFDASAFMQLITEYVNSGNMEVVQVLAEINATLSQEMIQTQLAAAQPQMSALMAQHEQALALANLQQQQLIEQMEQGEKPQLKPTSKGSLRSDLDRFIGLYGAPNNSSAHRQLWVSKSCEGQLVVGATWGDAAPWWMQADADAVFTYSDHFFSLAIRFTLDDNNQASELTHDLANFTSPLIRTGPLTADYPSCLEPHRR
ncbi:hypothetical protein [Marinicella litoralis]|uniref:Uncharacterized protein n=1 Tax=Marinicella litoralis TaxID=644220 RepID=A0A4R6XN40_9GAMM|nr:hypothetical protein [Marinicella litoralis]TDR17538.1 hypothetical protein C8D91_2597 [Marinicella litoralis]